jgi:hypothetical protein
MARKTSNAKAKQRKQIAILVGACVILAGVLAFQLPKIMKAANPAPAPAAAPPAAPVTPPPTSGAPVTELVEPTPAPAPGEGQLASFSLFESKDPFVQQVREEEAEAVVPEQQPAPVAPAPELPVPVAPPLPDLGATPEAPVAPATPKQATLAVNGKSEPVQVGADFPAATPLFRLVSVTGDSAEIAISGGSYQDGAATVTLKKGKTLTLMNTADGARYALLLVGVK